MTLGTAACSRGQTTWSLDVVARGDQRDQERRHRPHARRSAAHPEVISRRCTTEPPTLADVQANGPCLLASIGGSKKAKTLIVHWYATHNGFGRGG